MQRLVKVSHIRGFSVKGRTRSPAVVKTEVAFQALKVRQVASGTVQQKIVYFGAKQSQCSKSELLCAVVDGLVAAMYIFCNVHTSTCCHQTCSHHSQKSSTTIVNSILQH
jgi:hypothetical protein